MSVIPPPANRDGTADKEGVGEGGRCGGSISPNLHTQTEGGCAIMKFMTEANDNESKQLAFPIQEYHYDNHEVDDATLIQAVRIGI